MTDIDSLTGKQLDEAVAKACGYTQMGEEEIARVHIHRIDNENVFRCSHGSLMESHCLPQYDLGAAMELLMKCGRDINVFYGNAESSIEVVDMNADDDDPKRILATGPKSEIVPVLLRAFLKLKGR